jgi:acyl carrier protein phosphodiesterase
MNYLAHAYLSFEDEEILVGNMISDFVKGKKKFDYPENIQKGISLHRSIDEFTDSHATTKKAKEIFRPAYRLYSAAFIDVVYDHFLANDENEFPGSSLLSFSENVYSTLDKHINYLPERFSKMFPYMQMQNWLYHYKTKAGAERSFGGVVRRSKYLTEGDTAAALFEEHYSELEKYYRDFFPDLKYFSRNLYSDIKQL